MLTFTHFNSKLLNKVKKWAGCAAIKKLQRKHLERKVFLNVIRVVGNSKGGPHLKQ